MLTMDADPEVARDRYEALHGPIMEWQYGSNDPGCAANPDTGGEAAGAADALAGLLYEIADAADANAESDAEMTTWEEFETEVKRTAQTIQAQTVGFALTGPDGRSYWTQLIDR